ncbi:MAG: aromatic ring-hydroxylating dioxygenase subunit alpha [Actinobacteria bacterium]|nr:aromatic ring-hydroxylating dioxygenase subunit alpha [Actinomycetota bacterium]
MTYPKQSWYVAAATVDVGSTPIARTVCGEPIVLFRTTSGVAVAMDDRCPHRGFPLSAGSVCGDEIQCGYHGLRFTPDGRCSWAPGQDRVPARAQVTPRPVAEVGPWVWVWTGDPAAPDFDRLPAMPWLTEAGWAHVHGMEPLDARYGLLVDNLLDLSHETFLHGGLIGTPEVAETPITTTIDDDRCIVHVSRRMASVECPPFYSGSTGLRTPIDRWQDIEYHAPGYYLLHVRVAPAGLSPDDADHPDVAHLKVLYAITPVDDHRTMDFWAVYRDFAPDDVALDAFIAQANRDVVLQDVVALNLIEARLGDTWEPAEVSLKIDAGGLAARRVLKAMLESERAMVNH